MNASIRRFLAEEDGVTALEYGLLAAIVAGVLIAVANTSITAFFTNLFARLTAFLNTALPAG